DTQEVHTEVEMRGGEIGEAMRSSLMGDIESVMEILNRQITILLGTLQEILRSGFRHQAGGSKVVDFQPLIQELGVTLRLLMIEHPVSHCLQGKGAQPVSAWNRGRRKINTVIRKVSYRAGRS